MFRPSKSLLPAAPATALAGVVCALAFSAPAATQADVGGSARSSTPTTVPTFPVPASAKVGPGAAETTSNPSGSSVPGSTPLAGTSATDPFPKARINRPVHNASKVSSEAIVIGALAALLALGCLLWGIARLLAFQPRWALSMRHAIAEAELRTSSTWAELTDWLRLGH